MADNTRARITIGILVSGSFVLGVKVDIIPSILIQTVLDITCYNIESVKRVVHIVCFCS